MSEFDFGELGLDEKLVTTVKYFENQISVIEEHIDEAIKLQQSSKLSLNDSIKIDCYLTYLINTLYWINLKLQDKEVKEHPVNEEIARVRESINRDKTIDADISAPRLDVKAARRFIAHGMHVRFDDSGEID